VCWFQQAGVHDATPHRDTFRWSGAVFSLDLDLVRTLCWDVGDDLKSALHLRLRSSDRCQQSRFLDSYLAFKGLDYTSWCCGMESRGIAR